MVVEGGRDMDGDEGRRGFKLTCAMLQYIKAMRLFKDEPKWTPLNRGKETEENEFRKQYVEMREGRRFGDAVAV